jgi:CheY-like chemotaxis protein/two-component sensor histidine kinase
MRVVDLNRVVASFAGILRRTVRESIEIRLELTHGPASIRADRTQLEQVLMNLVVNAQDAIADAGVITIGTEPAVVDAAFALGHPGAVPGPHVRLVVRDSGRGIDKAAIERIFEPFFSTKEVGKGAGLGLAIVYGIVQQHGGFIDVASEPQRGTTFRIVFPRAEGVEAEETVAPETAPPAGEASGTVLLVEDNLDVMALVRRVLTARGYSVIAAPDPRLALELAGAGRIDLLVTDVVMPGMNGPELHRRLLKTHPGLKVLFMSGYTDNLVARQVDLDPGADFIQKPFAIETLARKVAALCPGAGTGPGPAS